MFCKARKIPLPLQDRVKEKFETMVRQGILEPVQLSGVTNTISVVWQRKINRALRLCVDLKVNINGKVMDEDYPIPDMETRFHNIHGASCLGKIDLCDDYYQSELDDDAKKMYTGQIPWIVQDVQASSGLKKFSSIFHNCFQSTLKEIKGVVIFQDNVLVYGTTKKQYEEKVLAAKGRLRERNFTIKERNQILNQSQALIFLVTQSTTKE